jgi:hypothetical protein
LLSSCSSAHASGSDSAAGRNAVARCDERVADLLDQFRFEADAEASRVEGRQRSARAASPTALPSSIAGVAGSRWWWM